MTNTSTAGGCVRRSDCSSGHIVEVYGPLDWRRVPDFRAAVADHHGAARLLVDLTGVDSIDSAGTSAVISSFFEAESHGVPMGVLAGGGVASILDRVGLAQVLPLFLDREQSDDWMRGRSA